jgi:hypothetical protein
MDDEQDKATKKRTERDALRIKDHSTGALFIVMEEDGIRIQGIFESTLGTTGGGVGLLFVDDV